MQLRSKLYVWYCGQLPLGPWNKFVWTSGSRERLTNIIIVRHRHDNQCVMIYINVRFCQCFSKREYMSFLFSQIAQQNDTWYVESSRCNSLKCFVWKEDALHLIVKMRLFVGQYLIHIFECGVAECRIWTVQRKYMNAYLNMYWNEMTVVKVYLKCVY